MPELLDKGHFSFEVFFEFFIDVRGEFSFAVEDVRDFQDAGGVERFEAARLSCQRTRTRLHLLLLVGLLSCLRLRLPLLLFLASKHI